MVVAASIPPGGGLESARQKATPGGPDEAALQKPPSDLRVFEDRRRTASFVCEARIGEIVGEARGAP